MVQFLKSLFVLTSFFDCEFTRQIFCLQSGVNEIFENGADFGNIIEDDNFKVSRIEHKAEIEITETGTEGAAATFIGFAPKSGGIVEDEKYVDINKPFLFLVRDTIQKVILFAGKYTNPNA